MSQSLYDFNQEQKQITRAALAEGKLAAAGTRLETLADQLERDRREPDKVLCYVLDLRRLARELKDR